MDEQLARSVADELVKVTETNGIWEVNFRAEVYYYKLMYDQEEVASSLAEALCMLAITAIKRYNGASPKTEPLPPLPGGPMPDLFAGELEAMSKILGRISGLLGREAHRLMDLRQAAADLASEADTVAHDMLSGSTRDSLLLKVGAVSEALTALSKE